MTKLKLLDGKVEEFQVDWTEPTEVRRVHIGSSPLHYVEKGGILARWNEWGQLVSVGKQQEYRDQIFERQADGSYVQVS